MLDLDGTTIPNTPDGLPSEKVVEAIKKASKLLHVGIATSRSYYTSSAIIKRLSLSGPSILNSGAQIIDLTHHRILSEHLISDSDFAEIRTILQTQKQPFFIQETTGLYQLYATDYIPNKLTQVFCKELSPEVADQLIFAFSHIPTIIAYKIPGYENGKVWITISNSLATKQQAIFEVAKILGIETYEIIGVGDGDNDFPLLMACGLKIAMGNAVQELKAIADYVAPSVDEDGVADIIEKFILNLNS